MLSLSKPFIVDELMVFRDHADADQFWYLPATVGIARRPGQAVPEFSCMMYRPAVAGAGIKGGGYLTFTSTLTLSSSQRSRIMSRCLQEPGVTGTVRLSVPPFDQGTVQCIALNLQGGGGTEAKPAAEGAFNAVQLIQGATVPAMDADNRAVFSLTLSQEGAIILRQAFSDGLAPIGVIYSLSYLAMRPALDVEITADFERIYTYFGGKLEGEYMFFKASLEAAFESLVSEGAITIKVTKFTDEADELEQERWALQFFKDELLSKWFEPTLAPGKLQNSIDDEEPKEEEPEQEEPEQEEPEQDNTEGERQPAELIKESQEPDPLPEGRSISHTPAATGTNETVRVTGAGASVTVAGEAVTLDEQGNFTVDVAAGSDQAITVSWPEGAAGEPGPHSERIFGLFFDFDKPSKNGWRVQPPSPELRAYVDNSTRDPRFQDASGELLSRDDGDWSGPERGAARLSAFVQQLPEPRSVRLEAFASHEDASRVSETLRRDHNQELSERRMAVAEAILGRAGVRPTSQHARGDSVSATRPGAHSPMGGDPDNRVVHVIATVPGQPGAAGTPASSWTGKLTRPAATSGNGNGGNGNGGSGETPKPPKPPKLDAKGASAALKLKFIRQEERKKLTFRYNRAEAVRRTVAPQGLLGLMLRELGDPSRLFEEIDLDHLYFRELEIQANAALDFAPIGLQAATLAIDYGDPAEPQAHKHGELRFSPEDRGPKTFTTFLNEAGDLHYAARFAYDFSAQSGWAADRFSYSVLQSPATERTRAINPYEHIEFRELRFEPGDIDWEIVSSIDVILRATGYTTPEPSAQLKLTKDSGAQVFRIRGALPVPPGRGVHATFRQTLVDGTEESTVPMLVEEPVVLVNDFFESALNLVFVPGFAPDTLELVFVDIEYHDDAHNYHRVFRQEVLGSATAASSVRVRVALRDPNQRSYRYRLTFIGTDRSFDQRAWETTSQEIISLR